ncbi:hypothetical protein [Nocardioides sp. MH1]|uniref:hypothetical protein n=1 Tax=Nocardioides sp. MH1 TaxID=3242490 RepID=UPI003522061E
MSDFDERLSAVLTEQADTAPVATGLADAARHRHARRRTARVAVGTAAAIVLAVPVGLAVAAGGGGADVDRSAGDPTTTVDPGGWRTVERDDVRVEMPGDWQRFTCDFDGFTSDVYGPTEHDACSFRTYLAFYGSATYDAVSSPGFVTAGTGGAAARAQGYVYAGEYAVSVATVDQDLTRHVLATARVAGQPSIDVTEWWGLEGDGLRAEIPARWGLGVGADLGDYRVCATPGDEDDPPHAILPGNATTVFQSLRYDGGRWIKVSAPTQALADLVVASANSAPGHRDESECAPQVAG